ncbi:MAG: zinc-binding dehydrogenase [Gemmataceae bacterium]|nr:zinc-binding dehydrogenase [Gemmataceae bacterium]
MAVDSRDRVFVFNRGDHPLMVFDRGGTFLASWGAELFRRPHGLTIGPDDAVYCTDDFDHTVRKFAPDGRLLLTLGTSGEPSHTGATGVDYRTIRRAGPPIHYPTNVALAADGSLYVTDGYGNARVHKFAADGRLLFSWGEPGDGPGQFRVPHGIAVDRHGTVCVADRENSRLQFFDPDGRYVTEWTGVARPSQVFIDRDGDFYVAELGYRAGMWPGTTAPTPDATGGRVSIFGPDGTLPARWGRGEPLRAGRLLRPARHLCRLARQPLRGRGRLVGGRQPRPDSARLSLPPKVHTTRDRTMKAWRFHGFDDLRLDDVPEPACGPGHVVVEPLCVQPSVTEAQLARGIPTLAYDRVKRWLETEASVQLIGHEFCARALEIGPGVTGFRPVDRMAARAKLPCGECVLCRTERGDLCRAGPVIGFDLPGCFAERARLPESALVKVDDRISDSEAACLLSLSDSVAAVETAGLRMASTVAILGQGSMGLECLQVARLSGEGLVITVDVREESCQVSRDLVADHALNGRDVDVVAAVRDLTGGVGADVVFECAGGSPKQGLAGHQSLLQAVDAVRSGGTIVGVSWFGGPLALNFDVLRERSLRYVFPDISTRSHLEYTVRLVASGRVRLEPTITHVLQGIGSVPMAFEITANKGRHQAINPAQVMMRG